MDDTKNPVLNPTDPSGTNPQADPPTPTPLVPDAPPAPPIPQDTPPAAPPDAPLPPMPEPGPFVPPSGEPGPPQPLAETPEEQPSDTDTGPPAGEAGLPPVITPPSASSGPKAKIIASIIGLVLLVISIPAGIILVGRQQEIRERAADNATLECGQIYGSRSWCSNNGGIPSGRTETAQSPSKDCAVCYQLNEPATASQISQAQQTVIPPAPVGQPASVNWGSRCDGASCETIQGLSCRNDFQGLKTCLLATSSVDTLGECKDQSECGANLTCKNGKCRINSGDSIKQTDGTVTGPGQSCCGASSQCKNTSGNLYKCDFPNGACESGFSCRFTSLYYPIGTGGSVVKVGWGSACNDKSTGSTDGPLCEEGQNLECRKDSKGTARCLKAAQSTQYDNSCQDQSECVNHTTCKGNLCLLNSGQPIGGSTCCGTSTQCTKDGKQYPCDTASIFCESGSTCSFDKAPVTTAAGPTGAGPTTVTGTACAITEFKVYKFPFGDGDKVDGPDKQFKAGDLIRFVAKVPANATRVEIQTCEASQPCDAKPFLSTDQIAGPPGSTYKYYKDLRLGNVGSVTAKARCAI